MGVACSMGYGVWVWLWVWHVVWDMGCGCGMFSVATIKSLSLNSYYRQPEFSSVNGNG